MSRTVALQSIGCRTNHQEMTDLSFRLKQAGFTVVDGVSADIVVLNTCCVTSTAEAKTRKAIQAISRNSPQTRILVTGCGAQHNPAQFAGAQIAWVVDNSSKSDIPQILEDDKPGTFANTQAEGANTPLAIGALPDSLADARLTRLPLKIQEGCNFSCTYCIVPSVRGPSRCADEAGLCSLFERAVGLGCKEFVLTGTHIGQYRTDGGGGLLALIEKFLSTPGDFRIRLSSLDPRDLSVQLLSLIGAESRVCAHAHVSVQSLDPDVLCTMARPHRTLEPLLTMLADFRSRFSGASLGGDFICGFPGETEAQFQNTLNRVGSVGFTYGHVFPFSKRPGTPATAFDGQIAVVEKNRRSRELRAALDASNARFYQSQLNTTQRIIVEESAPVRGTTSNYLRVTVSGSGAVAVKNSWITVIPTEVIGGQRRFCRAVPTGEREGGPV